MSTAEEFATSMHSEVSRFMMNAAEIYDGLDFNDPDALFNQPPPGPIINFAIGGALSVLGFCLWVWRVQKLKRLIEKNGNAFEGAIVFRAMISSAIDSDNPFYTIVSYAAESFLFLGGLQLDYQWTLLAMIVVYFGVSLLEASRVLLAFSSANSLADVVHTSSLVQSKLRTVSTDLRPSNVYEDLGRGRTIVLMVFATQVILISFVCVDIFEGELTRCRDGTPGCPVAGTLGSWGFYVLGIFMACVFLLGPKTSFGQSEQNPAYWLQLLLATKQTGAKVTWYDPVRDENRERSLSTSDLRTWGRFVMSFLINGVGFHILVHALPIQVAFQSSFTGVVFRAVGMMYLVDLDDTAGYTLTIEQKKEEPKPEVPSKTDAGDKPEKTEQPAPTAAAATPNETNVDTNDLDMLSAEAQKIIEEARTKLDLLAKGKATGQKHPQNNLVGGALLLAASTTPSPEVHGNDDENEGGEAEENAAVQPSSRSLPLGNNDKKQKTSAAAAAANVEDDGPDVDEGEA